MRLKDIRFKAKRLDNKEWVKGYYYQECGNTYIIEDRQNESGLNRNLPYEVDPSTVCQYTGLKDKDGQEIWEHDLLKVTTCSKPREVVFKYGAFLFWCDYLDSYSVKDGTCELIKVGNKFDKEV